MVCIARFEKPYYSDPVHTAEQAKIAAAKTYKWRRAHETKPSLVIQPVIALPAPAPTPEPPKPEPIWPLDKPWIYDYNLYDRAGRFPPKFVYSIKLLICMEFNVTLSALDKDLRFVYVVIPRFIAIYLTKVLTNKSYSEIGRLFHRDHSTIMHGIKKITEHMRRDAELCQHVVELQNHIELELLEWRSNV